jgi:hypothetical protein
MPKMSALAKLKEVLLKKQFLILKPLYSKQTIEVWNEKFNAVFSSQNLPRRYVNALDIFNAGLLKDVFTPQLQQLIYGMMPDAVLFHCHSYEIDANNARSHIADDVFLDGWHRDIDCLHYLDSGDIQHISLFVYLTDVYDTNGAFEVCDKVLGYFPRLFKSFRFYKIIGAKGHTFLFSRSAFHRASPNISNVPRRVLKISWQSKRLPNNKLDLNQFTQVKRQLDGADVFLRQLFGDDQVSAEQVSTFMAKSNCPVELGGKPEKINLSMGLLKEFRGVVKDLVYVKRLIIYKFLN